MVPPPPISLLSLKSLKDHTHTHTHTNSLDLISSFIYTSVMKKQTQTQNPLIKIHLYQQCPFTHPPFSSQPPPKDYSLPHTGSSLPTGTKSSFFSWRCGCGDIKSYSLVSI
jgi:hypothetical protein